MLCDICQGFDLRSLLYKATAGVPKQDPPINWNYPEVLEFYKHRAGLSALKQFAENGCDLCMLFWDTCTHVAGKEQVVQVLQEGKTAAVEQDIYIGTDAWNPQTHNLPNVVITQNSHPDSDPECADLRVLGLFEVYAERGSIPLEKDLVFGRNVYRDPSSDECLAVASEWLEKCSTTHKNCPKPKEHPLPTRVIDVGPPEGSEEPFVSVSNGQSGVWAALSYCWGGNSSFVLKQDAAKLYRREVPLQDYPETIRDAIVVTRKLNIPFLWVDALCIIQDSAADWEYESARMTHVYKNALVTIAAAQSPTSFHGILKKRPALGLNCKIPLGQNRGEHVFLRAATQLWDDALRSSTLDTRGWVLQETLLAPKTVSFGQQQMFWECATCEAQEGGRTTKQAHIYRNKSLLQDMFRSKGSSTIINRFWSLIGQQPSTKTVDAHTRWLGIVGEYTSRRLTNDMDILPALSGLASEFHRFTGDRYLAGLWEKDLIHSLMWTYYLPPADDGHEAPNKPTQAYRAPSWSWASLKGVNIAFPARGKQSDLEWEAEVVKVDVTLAGADPFGRLMGGSLTVKAPFQIIGDVRREDSTVGASSSSSSKLDEWMSTVWNHETTLAFQQAHRDSPGQHFALIQLRRWSASPGLRVPSINLLLLESTGTKNEYRRICRLHLFKQEMREEQEIPGSYDGLKLEKNMWKEIEHRKWEPKVVTIV